MIVPMRKAYVVCRGADRERLLEALRALGVLHLVPVDPAKAVAAEQTTAAVARLARAAQVLAAVEPAGDPPDVAPEEAAAEAVEIHRRSVEGQSRLTSLYRQVEQLAPWGEVRLEQFAALREAGLDVKFYEVPDHDVPAVRAECVQVLGELPGRRSLLAVVHRGGPPELPPAASEVPLPARDRPSLRAEAAELDAALKADAERLRQLAHLVGKMEHRRRQLQQQAELAAAAGGGLAGEDLFAVQGWVPAPTAGDLDDGLAKAGVPAAVRTAEPDDADTPPTQIAYPRWTRPIRGLFDILGTLPGYREMDLSPFFMVAMPLFAAMLIGDAGYGLVFTLVPALLYRRLVRAAGKAKTHLLLVIGVATLAWGILSANYFGVTPETLARAGGFTRLVDGKAVPDYDALRAGGGAWAAAGRAMIAAAPAWHEDPDQARYLLMKIAFVIGTIHLVLAHLRRAIEYAPDLRFLAEVGWAVVLGDMLVLIWYLMFIDVKQTPSAVWAVLAAGFALPVLFGAPKRNPAARVLAGLGAALLPLLGTFSDTMSYIRLMAVGLASYYIAAAFNGLGAMLADSIGWYTVVPVLVVVFGHALNIGLAGIAIFAHGVRLNMLEFSNNAGVQWAGYAYAPFAAAQSKE